MREIVDLKERIANLEGQIAADHTLMAGLRSRLQQLEAELNDYKEIAEQTCNVSHCGRPLWCVIMRTICLSFAVQENVLLKRQIEASATEKGAQSETEGIMTDLLCT